MKASKLTTVMITSDCNKLHEICRKIVSAVLNSCKSVGEAIKQCLEDKGLIIQEMYVVQHMSEQDDIAQGEGNRKNLKYHYHVLIKFKNGYGDTLKNLATYIGIAENFIEKPHAGRYSYNNMLAYLIHAKYGEKIQYAPEVVETLAGKDYKDYYADCYERWLQSRSIVDTRESVNRLMKKAVRMINDGRTTLSELRRLDEFQPVFCVPKYDRELERLDKCAIEVAKSNLEELKDKIKSGEITSYAEIMQKSRYMKTFCYLSGKIKPVIVSAREKDENIFTDCKPE